ncbi:MAG: nucleoside triphosphate pyrophosphohydrolase [Maricaulaceae bacterium]
MNDDLINASFHALGDTPYERVKNLMVKLRSPGGCPWDIEQNFETIAPYTIEEAYEVSDAITHGDRMALKEELGDLFFQSVFHAQMADEEGAFNLDDVVDNLVTKMIRRHPHVFDKGDDRSADEQTVAWEQVKAAERAAKGQTKTKGTLADVALALPALMRAEKLQKRAARVGFDWPDLDGVIHKINEESQELKDAYESGKTDDIEDEMGDVLFAVTNLARKMGVDPEVALRRTNDKFTRRFSFIETQAKKESREISELSLDEMEAHWQAAKTAE